MYLDAGRMGLSFPLLGTGAGTFLSAYPFYRSLPTNAVTVSPHNEYLHVFAETGLAGLGICLVAMAMLYRSVRRGLVNRRSPFARGFLAGGVGALLMVALHSLVDFPMRSPAIAATVAVAAALMYRAGSVESSSRGRQKRLWPHPFGGLMRRRWDAAVVVLAVVAIPWAYACSIALKPLRGQLAGGAIAAAQKVLPDDAGEVAVFAQRCEMDIEAHSPGDARLYARVADLCADAAARSQDPVGRQNLAGKALGLRMRAARLEPVSADHPFDAAMAFANFQRPDLARLQAERACELLPRDPWIRARLAEGFLARGQSRLAEDYLARAEELARARGIEGIEPLLGRVQAVLAGAVAARGRP